MGKVKDDAQASKSAKPSKGKPASATSRRVSQFVGNLVSTELYKPRQGWYARLYTALGLGVLVVLGLWRLHETLISTSMPTRYGVPVAVGALLGWAVFRLVQYPPFVEFLIATEAEMNKVSWTSRDDLQRATSVVLITVLLMAVFLFGVDWVWSKLLQVIGVLRFKDSSGSLGSSG